MAEHDLKNNVDVVLNYNVDLVFCVDTTASMAPFVNEFKATAKSLRQKFIDEYKSCSKGVGQLRVKVITFKDFEFDRNALIESPFFVLCGQLDQNEDFVAYVNKIEANGGGDLSESALEALSLAIRSKWERGGAVRRHVILMFTDAAAKPLGTTAPSFYQNYSNGMPTSFAELAETWESQEMEMRAKRLLIYAPDCEPWTNMVDWTNTFHAVSKEGTGLPDVEMDTCIHMLVNSI